MTRFCWMVRAMPCFDQLATSFQPMNSNIITPESITELGLITSLSAYFGAVPCVASKHAEAIADVRAGRHAQPADLRGAGVGNVVAVQIWRGEHLIFIRARQHLLEHGIGDAVVDHDLLLPLAAPVASRKSHRESALLRS